MRLFANDADVVRHVIPVARERLADVDDHVDLRRAVLTGERRLVALGLRAGVAMRKADDRPDQHAAALKQLHRALHRVGLDAHGRDLILGGNFAAVLQLLVRHRRMQEGVINHLRQFFVGVFHVCLGSENH